jgi:uncharacterized protein
VALLGSLSVFRRLWNKVRLVVRLAKNERATPREVGWAIFWGVFAGCTPAVGFHGPVALALATLFRKNRLFAWLGSRISNVFFLPFLALAEIQLSHRLRTGSFAALDREHVLEQAGELLLDWCLGTIPVGFALGAIMGALAFRWAERRARRRELAQDPRQSSESPA